VAAARSATATLRALRLNLGSVSRLSGRRLSKPQQAGRANDQRTPLIPYYKSMMNDTQPQNRKR